MTRNPGFTKPRRCVLLVAITIVVLATGVTKSNAEVSGLWGQHGERWSPDSRLPDFSFAGYRRGEEPFRVPRASVSIKSFGAKGDGRTDDTEAFRQAIAGGEGKVIELPAGRYRLSDVLEIKGSDLILRGAGSESTVLEFIRPLEAIRPRPAHTDGGQPTSDWSWGGGLVTIGGKLSSMGAATLVKGEARRGDNMLELDATAFDVGDELILTLQDDRANTLLRYLYRGDTGDISGLRNWSCQQVFRATGVDGQRITLDRGLRFDICAAWKPMVRPFAPAVTDVGLEGIAFEFPAMPYGGHFKEVGFNPIEIGESAAHCWLRDIRIHNADSGPYIRGTFCTLDGIRLTADAERVSQRSYTGHHGITFYANDCLCTNFSIETRFIHDLTVQSAVGCVFESGSAVDLSMDHHRWAPYENLYSDIDGGEGTRLFASSGGLNRGRHSAAGATFWNIRSKRKLVWPSKLGPDAISVVGVPSDEPPLVEPEGRWFEPIPPEELRPARLHRAMLQRRSTLE